MTVNMETIKSKNKVNTKNCILIYENKQEYNQLMTNIPLCNFQLEKSSLSNNVVIQGDNSVVMKELLKELQSNSQAYVISPLINESDLID